MIRVNSASDVYFGSTTMKVVVLLRLTGYTGACFLAYLISRAHNQTETGAAAGDLFDYIATLQFSICSRCAVEEVSDYYLNVGTQTQPR